MNMECWKGDAGDDNGTRGSRAGVETENGKRVGERQRDKIGVKRAGCSGKRVHLPLLPSPAPSLKWEKDREDT